jgi:acetoin utilization deacetylase AcuC-like enzyme/formylglycine-generating enzyme required for sulfatase activity
MKSRKSNIKHQTSNFVLAFCLLSLSCRRVEVQNTVPPQVVQTPGGVEMVVIPAGSFEMGNNGVPDESPVHKVWISSFWMDRREVPQEQFRKYQMSDPSHFKGPNQPLERVNWSDAAMYCNERSMAEGLTPCYDEDTWICNFDANGYRLPTEAEWEYACRAGTSSRYSFGDDVRLLKDHAWFNETASDKTHPLGQKKPNPWGLYDMHGNVSEWCNDRYAKNYYSRSPDHDPRGPDKGNERVLRGGSWKSTADACRATYRASDPSINDTCLAADTIGFRCVRKAPESHRQATLAAATQALASDVVTGPKSKTALVYDDIYLEHKTTPGHQESPQRLIAIIERLKKDGLYAKLVHLAPVAATEDQICAIHSPEYVRRARQSCERGDPLLDTLDVPISSRSYEAAVMAAGGVIVAADAVAKGKVANAFCAVRPPGHHARSNQAMGFCIFNNVAIATRYVQRQHGMARVLIVDWDVHHGNGTQEAFYDDPNVLYFSVHQWPFYPGTGSTSEKGAGRGLSHTINVPLPAGSGDKEFLQAFEQQLRPAALAFSPQFVFISAGFDAHDGDTIGRMKVTTEGYARLTRIVKEIANTCCEGRIVSVLEGGYNLDALADAVEAHIRVLMES